LLDLGLALTELLAWRADYCDGEAAPVSEVADRACVAKRMRVDGAR
jgi:hypothetical protein